MKVFNILAICISLLNLQNVKSDDENDENTTVDLTTTESNGNENQNTTSTSNKTNDSLLIDYYEQLIDGQLARFEVYQDPVDAREFEGNYYDQKQDIKVLGDFDFIVVGGGSSGAVIASRLSEIPSWKVLLLEAGQAENNFTDIPGFYFYSRFTEYNWGYYSVPQKFACQGMVDKRCPFPRGRGLGGTSLINGLIYSRGSHKDFDIWNTYIRNGDWSFDAVLPYFKKAESTHIPNVDLAYHGTTGPLPVNYHIPTSPETQAFLDAHQELNVPLLDINGANQNGASLNQFITDNGRRVSTAKAYLPTPKNNLIILTRAYVTRLLQDGYGVEFTYQGQKTIATCSKEVILSAGVFGTPHILLHSGIGPFYKLLRHGIPILRHSPFVGFNLQDHATFYGLIFQSNYQQPIKSRRSYIEDYLKGEGPYTIAGNLQAISFHETILSQIPGVPDIELLFVPSNSTSKTNQKSFHLTNITYDTIWGNTDPTNTFIVYVILLKPRSLGYVTINSNDPFKFPLIHPNFLSDFRQLDIESIYLGVKHVLKLIETEAFQKFNATLIPYTLPACKEKRYLSRAYWYCTIRQMTMNVYHPMGTCAMKDKETGGVVDGNLRVYGVDRLRVVDLSVVPFAISGHPHATAVMIAEKAADMIKAEYNVNEGNTKKK